MPGRKQRNTSAHHPDILARLGAQAVGKNLNRFPHELDIRRHGNRRWSAREYIVRVMPSVARSKLQTTLEGLAAENLGINRALEFGQAVKPFWRGPPRQPIKI